jgi:twitching motility protein PilJ
MTERLSTRINSESATPAPQLNNGKASPNTSFTNQVNNRQKKFSHLPPVLNDDWEQRSEDAASSRSQQIESRLRAKVIAIAIAIGMLPVLAVGAATYYFGARAITEQATQSKQAYTIGPVEAELMQQRQLQLLTALLVGTGATALLSGAIAALWANRAIRSARSIAAATTTLAARQARAVRSQLFTDAVYQIRASLNKADILKAAVEETRKAIAVDRVLVYSLDENSQGIVIAESVAPGWPKALKAMIKDPCFGARYIKKYQNGRVHAIDDIYEPLLTPCYLEQLETFAVRANLVAPLLNEENLIGLLIAHQCSGPRVWQQSEIDLFTQIATQVGFALDNAKLLGRVEQMSQDAEALAYERRQEKAALRQQISALLRDSEAAFKTFSTEASRQAETVTAAISQIQAIADSARGMVSSTQKAELQVQQTSLVVKAGHETVNQTMDSIAAIQETVVDAAVKVKHLAQAAQKLSQFVSLAKDLMAQMNHQAINAVIGAGRAADAGQESVVFIAEAVHSLTQQLTRATKDIEPLVAELETEANTVAAAMETGTKQVTAGIELTKETRQKLNELTTMSAKIGTLVSNMALSAAGQAQTLTEASQTVLEVANLADRTSKQSAAVAESFTKLAVVAQEVQTVEP